MESLYHQTNKSLMDIQNRLGIFERSLCGTTDFNALELQLVSDIESVLTSCDRLDMMVSKESPSRRTTAKLRIDQLKYDLQHIQAALSAIQRKKFQKMEEDRERDQLLRRNFTSNESENTSIMIDAALQHNHKTKDASKSLDNLIYTGTSILSNLREQGGSLKTIKHKMLDFANVLGLSNTIMRLIERRTQEDKVILIAGMLVTCLIMLLVYIYLL